MDEQLNGHTHRYQGQTLEHTHPGGSVPHGYFGHAEDFTPGTIEPGEVYIDPHGTEIRRDRQHIPQLRDSDSLVRKLGPDAHLAIDAYNCIVLVTPERRIDITNVALWRDELLAARMRVAERNHARRQE